MGEGGVGLDQRPALADAIVEGDQHGDLRGEPEALAQVRVVGVVRLVGVVAAQRGDRRPQDFHRRHVFGKGAQQLDDLRIDDARLGQFLAKGIQLSGFGQPAVPEEVSGFLEVRLLGELVDVMPR